MAPTSGGLLGASVLRGVVVLDALFVVRRWRSAPLGIIVAVSLGQTPCLAARAWPVIARSVALCHMARCCPGLVCSRNAALRLSA